MSAIQSGRATVQIDGDRSPLDRTLAAVRASMRKFGGELQRLGWAVGAIGAGGAAAAAIAVRRFQATGDQLDKMSARVGVAVESLSELGHAARLGGADLDTVESAIKAMQATLLRAEQGSARAVKPLNALGVSAKELGTLTVEQQFTVIAEALSRIKDDGTRAALALRVFGDAGQKLLPAMAGGAAGLAAARDEAKRLNVVMSSESAAAAAAMEDALTRVSTVVNALWVTIGAALAPGITDLANRLAAALGPLITWISNNSQLAIVIAAVSAGLVALGAVLAAAGAALSAVAVVGTTLVSALGAMLSPIGLVVAAVAGLGAAFVALIGPSRVWQWLGETLTWLGGVASTALLRLQHVIANWRDYLDLAIVTVSLKVVGFAEDLRHFFTVAVPAYLMWLQRNWIRIFQDIANATVTILRNMGDNLASFFAAVRDVLGGKGFDWKPKALLEGFESALDALPEIARRRMGPLERALKRSAESIAKGIAESFEAMKRESGAPGAPAAPDTSRFEAEARAADPFIRQREAIRQGIAAASIGTFSSNLAGFGGFSRTFLDKQDDQLEAIEDNTDAVEDVAVAVRQLRDGLTFA